MNNRRTFRELTPAKKLEHIWLYYRVPIIAGCLALVLLISLVTTLSGGSDSLLDVIMVDSNANAHTDTDAFSEFLTECGITPYPGAVSLNTNLSFYSEEEMDQLSQTARQQAVLDNYDKEQMLFTMMAAGKSEVFFSQDAVFRTYADQGMFRDLSQVLPEALLAQYADQLLYGQEDGEDYPCGILLENNAWLQENGYYTRCCFGLLYLSDEPELAAQFAEYLLTHNEKSTL